MPILFSTLFSLDFWNFLLLALLLFTGIRLTCRMSWFPFRHPLEVLRQTVFCLGGKKSPSRCRQEGLSSFQAAATSLAGTMGIGNLVGVSTAIALGGPGSVFWMIVGALLGLCTKYQEIFLALTHRRTGKDGSPRGGPMYYLEDLGAPRLAWIFSIACCLCALGIGTMTQSNAAAQSLAGYQIPPVITGVLLALACWAALSREIKGIGILTEKLVPILSVLYLGAAGWILWLYRANLPATFRLILSSAFSFKPIAGGGAGLGIIVAMRYGFARGMFSNEAGLGSAPITHGETAGSSPHRQGLWGMVEVFWDTVAGCTATGLVILVTGVWQACAPQDIGNLTTLAFRQAFGSGGELFIAISTLLFAFASILGWWVCGKRALEYVTGAHPKTVLCYKAAFLTSIGLGALVSLRPLWACADFCNLLMALPNLIALLAYSGQIVVPALPKRRRLRLLFGGRECS